MPDQNDARRRLLVALALERSRAGSSVHEALRRAVAGDQQADASPRSSSDRQDETPDDASRS